MGKRKKTILSKKSKKNGKEPKIIVDISSDKERPIYSKSKDTKDNRKEKESKNSKKTVLKTRELNNKRYKKGDLVFAKFPGYPHWPARIIKKISDKEGFDVFFYGTHENYVLKGEKLYDYATNFNKFGISTREPKFKKALDEISTDPDKHYNEKLKFLEWKDTFQESKIVEERDIKKKELLEKQEEENNNSQAYNPGMVPEIQEVRREIKYKK